MQEYIKQAEYLCGLADNPVNGYAQITIDFFEDFEDQFLSDRNLKDEPIERDEVGAKSYEIGNILQIMDQNRFKKDFEIFSAMSRLLNSWQIAIENNNRLKGIPIHKG